MAEPMVEYLAEMMVDLTSDCWEVRLDELMAGVMAESMVAKRVVRTAGEKASRSGALMAGMKDLWTAASLAVRWAETTVQKSVVEMAGRWV